MSQNQSAHSPAPEEGDTHCRQPKADDVVMGGEASHPIDGVVLGGVEGVKRCLVSTAMELRIAALSEALQYGEAGLDLVMAALEDESRTLQFAAYSLLKDRQEARVKQRLRHYLPWFEFEVVTVNAKGQEINRERRQAQYFTEDLGDGVPLEMVYIPGGRFMMGSPAGKGNKSEKPQHEVTVQPFFMGKYPITQAQWRAIASRADVKVKRSLDPNPAHFKDCKDSDRRPVEQVFWYGAVEFCQRLSNLGVMKYHLPSEAEWEYACRAGTTTPFYFGGTITTDLANYNSTNDTNDIINCIYVGSDGYRPMRINRQETTSVGSFPPNAFGLYDMHGNVWEWCEDHWHDHYEGAPNDGSAWIDSKAPGNPKHVMRGGSWLYTRYFCRCASRYSISLINITNIGFRVVCELPMVVQ